MSTFETSRAAGHPIDNGQMDRGSFPAPIEGERARNEMWVPIPASAMKDHGDSIEWVWQGYLALGFITLLNAYMKAGKTTLISWLLRAIDNGEYMAGDINHCRVLVVTEEPKAIWGRRIDDLGLSDKIHFITMPFLGRPQRAEYESFLADVIWHIEQNGYGLVILDTWSSVSPCDNENDASKMQAALMPLRQFTQAGAALLLVHHNRKGDGTEGQGGRGSSALPGFVDIILEFRRYEPENQDDCRRTITGLSRFEETPNAVVLELRDDGYSVVGSKAEAKQADRFEEIKGILVGCESGLTVESIREQWPTDGVVKPGERKLRYDLEAGFTQGLWSRSGNGKRGDAYVYSTLPDDQDSLSARSGSIDASNESAISTLRKKV